MPPGSKKRKAAKKKQEQASSTQINLKSNNLESRSHPERESDDVVSSQENYKTIGLIEDDAVRIEKEPLDTDERIEITDSSHDHDKSSSSSSSSSSSDDESQEVKKGDDNKVTDDSSSEVITVPDQPVPIAGDAPFMGSTANVIVESTGIMDSATLGDPKSEEQIEISPVETTISNGADQISLPEPTETTAKVPLAANEIRQASSGATDSDVKVKEGNTSPLPESKGVPEGTIDSEVVVSHEEEAPVRPTHGIAQRTSWLSCCGLFDVVTGSSR